MIEPTFWNDPDFDDISDVATLATYLYLISNAAVSPTGCYPLSRRTAAYDLRMQIDEVEKHLTALKGKVEYDGETSWVWIKGYFPRQYKATANRNILKSVLRSINELRLSNCPFTKEFDDLNSCLINELLTRNEPVPNGQGLDTG